MLSLVHATFAPKARSDRSIMYLGPDLALTGSRGGLALRSCVRAGLLRPVCDLFIHLLFDMAMQPLLRVHFYRSTGSHRYCLDSALICCCSIASLAQICID